jgi:hypothetical protein
MISISLDHDASDHAQTDLRLKRLCKTDGAQDTSLWTCLRLLAPLKTVKRPKIFTSMVFWRTVEGPPTYGIILQLAGA